MKSKPAPAKSTRRPPRRDARHRARQLALLKREVEAECRSLIEMLNLVLRELRSWK